MQILYMGIVAQNVKSGKFACVCMYVYCTIMPSLVKVCCVMQQQVVMSHKAEFPYCSVPNHTLYLDMSISYTTLK